MGLGAPRAFTGESPGETFFRVVEPGVPDAHACALGWGPEGGMMT